MGKEDFLLGFFKQRVDVALDEYIRNNRAYREAENKANMELLNLEAQGFTKQQRLKIDRVASAYNAFGSVYGEEAYKFGFWDGIRLCNLIGMENKGVECCAMMTNQGKERYHRCGSDYIETCLFGIHYKRQLFFAVFEYGIDDYELWINDMANGFPYSMSINDIKKYLTEHETEGSSVRGPLKDIMEELLKEICFSIEDWRSRT